MTCDCFSPAIHPTAHTTLLTSNVLSCWQVPLVWAATLAYHGQFLLTEAGLVGQVRAQPCLDRCISAHRLQLVHPAKPCNRPQAGRRVLRCG